MSSLLTAVLVLVSAASSFAIIAIIPLLSSSRNNNRPSSSSYSSYSSYYNTYGSSSSSNNKPSSYSHASNSGSFYASSGNQLVAPPTNFYGSVRNAHTQTTDARPDYFAPYTLTNFTAPTGAIDEDVNIVFANYYRHCTVSEGYGLAGNETYIIYGLAPPPPDNVAYSNFTVQEISGDVNSTGKNVTTFLGRGFTDVCFFTVTDTDSSNARLRITLTTGAATEDCTAVATYQWPDGCSLNLYSGNANTDWTSADLLLSVTSNSQRNCRHVITTDQNAVGVETKWCQLDGPVNSKLNFTLTIESYWPPPVVKTATSLPDPSSSSNTSPTHLQMTGPFLHYYFCLIMLLSLSQLVNLLL